MTDRPLSADPVAQLPPTAWRTRLLSDYERQVAPYIDRELPFTVELWAWERLRNSLDLAAQREGEDQAGWIEDARYWRMIVERLSRG